MPRSVSVALTEATLAQARQVQRLRHTRRPAETVGQLSWACLTPGVWWPAEMLDPLAMPPGRSLPPGATSSESRGHLCCKSCMGEVCLTPAISWPAEMLVPLAMPLELPAPSELPAVRSMAIVLHGLHAAAPPQCALSPKRHGPQRCWTPCC